MMLDKMLYVGDKSDMPLQLLQSLFYHPSFYRKVQRSTPSTPQAIPLYNFEVHHPRCAGSITKNIVYYTYS